MVGHVCAVHIARLVAEAKVAVILFARANLLKVMRYASFGLTNAASAATS
jgi:hypothetical protein